MVDEQLAWTHQKAAERHNFLSLSLMMIDSYLDTFQRKIREFSELPQPDSCFFQSCLSNFDLRLAAFLA